MSMRWHSQGLSRVYARWPHGRGWLYFGGELSKIVGMEWVFGGRSCGATLDLNWVDGCDGVMLYLALPFLGSLYIVLEHIIPKAWLPGHWAGSRLDPGEQFWRPEQRRIGVRVFDWRIWISLWDDAENWSADDPWWWQFTITPLDILLGRERHKIRDIERGEIVVPMPEGNYQARYRVFESVWRRVRWPWQKQVIRTDIELEQAIPFSGKGENSWDCGDDGLWGATVATDLPARAALEVVTSVLETRRKRGDPECWPVVPQTA